MEIRTSPRSTSRTGGADLKFDHLGYLVADLARAASRLGRGGFALTERVGLVGPDGEWSGGDQQVAGLPDGYLEVQQLVDRTRGHVLLARSDAVPSVAVLAWLSVDLDRDINELARAGVPLGPPQGWSRRTTDGVARFRFTSVLDDRGPLRVIVEHLDPHLTRRSTSTANGIIRVVGIRREGDDAVTPVDTDALEDTVRALTDARPITAVMLECEGADSLRQLEGSGWAITGTRCHSREDLGADMELTWKT
jgi:hypothetical protein